MIRNYCDACGTETQPGSNIPDQKVWLEPKRQTKRHVEEGHTKGRSVRVAVHLGIDDINPQPEHPGHDLCDSCRISILRTLIERLEDEF